MNNLKVNRLKSIQYLTIQGVVKNHPNLHAKFANRFFLKFILLFRSGEKRNPHFDYFLI